MSPLNINNNARNGINSIAEAISSDKTAFIITCILNCNIIHLSDYSYFTFMLRSPNFYSSHLDVHSWYFFFE